MDYVKEEKGKIIEELLSCKKIVAGQLINYAKFLELHKIYKDRISEREFAKILGITESSFNMMKNQGQRVKILKDKVKKITEKEIKEIKEEILKKVKPGQAINYEELLELYKPYKGKLNEVEFAKIIGISYANFTTIKNKGTRAKILKEKLKKMTEEEGERIKEEILKKVKPGKAINYAEFLELYEPYKGELSEVEFAEILRISYSNLNTIKHQGTRAKILKEKVKKVTEEEKEEIRGEVLKKVKAGQLINYAEFLELYEPYKGKLSEVEFATILDISYYNIKQIKSRGTRTRVLKEKIAKISKEEKEKVIEEILKKVEPRQMISYEEFKELYKPYMDKLSEEEFAEILGINYENFKIMKKQGTKAKILKEKVKKITEEEGERIKEEILRKVKLGQTINYEKFKDLYEPYERKLTQIEFAKIIGISESNFHNIRNQGTRAKVRDYREKEKIDRVKYILKQESRYYTKEELEKLAIQYRNRFR